MESWSCQVPKQELKFWIKQFWACMSSCTCLSKFIRTSQPGHPNLRIIEIRDTEYLDSHPISGESFCSRRSWSSWRHLAILAICWLPSKSETSTVAGWDPLSSPGSTLGRCKCSKCTSWSRSSSWRLIDKIGRRCKGSESWKTMYKYKERIQ